MNGARWMVLGLIGLAGGCMSPRGGMASPEKPRPAPEMKRLEQMLGTWTGTAEIVSPSPEEMKKMMPEGAQDIHTSFKSTNKVEWALGGMFLKQEGFHEMPGGERDNFIEYMTWDPKEGKYHAFWFSDRGQTGDGWFTMSEDGTRMELKAKGREADGSRTSGRGSIRFIDDKTMEWSWTEKGPKGEVTAKGTSRK